MWHVGRCHVSSYRLLAQRTSRPGFYHSERMNHHFFLFIFYWHFGRLICWDDFLFSFGAIRFLVSVCVCLYMWKIQNLCKFLFLVATETITLSVKSQNLLLSVACIYISGSLVCLEHFSVFATYCDNKHWNTSDYFKPDEAEENLKRKEQFS